MAEINLRPSSTTIIASKRNSGKSFLAKWLLMKMVEQEIVDVVYIFSPTERLSKSFGCFPEQYILDGYDYKFIEKVMESQRKAITKYGKGDKRVAKVLFLFDDILGSIKQGSPEYNQLNKLFALSRHVEVGLMILSQTARGLITPTLRNNVDNFFVRLLNENQLPSVYETVYYDGSYKEFLKWYKNIMANSTYEFIYYDNLNETKQKWFSVLAEECDYELCYKRQERTRKAKDKKEEKTKANERK